jgi:arsenical pump membrane protein
VSSAFIWCIVGVAIAGILFRPREWPEAVWACLGATLLVITGLLPVSDAGKAIGKGTDVYLFLAGMMLLAALAQRNGVFEWLASHAVAAARGSCARLFTLVYIVGVIVTVFLSNDATAVVLTPAVYAAVRKARTKALPYLFVCAFIANAASFVLPISNPANLVVYGSNIPPLKSWLKTFFIPSLVSIVATYIALRWFFRKELTGKVEDGTEPGKMSREGRLAAWGILCTGGILIAVSWFGFDLGLPTCVAAVATVLIASRDVKEIVKGVSWSVLPLVAGLFVLVEALNRAGALQDLSSLLNRCSNLPRFAGSMAASFGIAGLSNVMNNLPSGLLAGGALKTVQVHPYIRNAVLIGVDLGPNLSVTGSLATVLWLIALRREGERISGWTFFKAGLLVMPPALFLATSVLIPLSK